MTERLYYTDSFLYQFDARVLDVLERPDASGQTRSAVILDRSAFYPTSGGQLCDTGSLVLEPENTSGETTQILRVNEVVEAEDGAILHLVKGSLVRGTRVAGMVDVPRRRDHMQQHTGQHLLSAAFVRLFDAPTVSFHMGAEGSTIDLETRALTAAQLEATERLANEVIAEDRPVEIEFLDAEQARARGVRKLPQAGHEKLRLIHIRDFDLTACGGTHVRSTGQIGCILLRKPENVKQGVRVEFVCGGRAVATARRDYATLSEAAAIYSTHIREVPQQIRKAQEEMKAAYKAQQRLLEEVAELHAARLLAETAESGGWRLITHVFADRDVAFIKLLAQKVTAVATRPAVALLASTAGPPTLVFAQTPGQPFNMGALLKDAVTVLGGRGGGSNDMAQGGVPEPAGIEAALDQVAAKLRALR